VPLAGELLAKGVGWVIARRKSVGWGNSEAVHWCFQSRGKKTAGPELDPFTRRRGAPERPAAHCNPIVFKRFSVLGAVRTNGASLAVGLVTFAANRAHHGKRGHFLNGLPAGTVEV
jgi:hypothetical protein